MPNPLDSLKNLHRKVFVKGQEAVAEEVAARDHAERQKLYQEGMRLASETIDQANQLAKDSDPHKRELAALIKDTAVRAVKEATDGYRAEEGRGAIEASPFPGGSQPSLNGSTTSETGLPGSTLKALPSEPPKRKRGRPRKSP